MAVTTTNSASNYNEGNNHKITSLIVKGDLVVKGNLTVTGSSKLNELETMNLNLIQENKLLKERMQELEEKINQLWYAPYMPGYEIAKLSYTETHNN